MNFLLKIKKAILHRWIMRNPDSFTQWMRSKGVHIGNNFKISSNPQLSSSASFLRLNVLSSLN